MKLTVTDDPSFTVNVLVIALTVVPSYEANPLPVDVIAKVWVIASNITSTLVSLLMLLTVYSLFDRLEVMSVPSTLTLLILYPSSGVKVMVAEEPSFNVNVLVLLRIVVSSYEAEPFPVDVIDKECVIASNSTSTLVFPLILLTVYSLLDKLDVTSVPFTLMLLTL